MSAVDNIIMSKCAACGKDRDTLKACTACKLVKYCNVTCQKAHRPKHKKECKKRAAEIFDEALFKTPPPNEDCPICFLRLPLIESDKLFKSCCGKMICTGCGYADVIARRSAEHNCPFCRTPAPTSEEEENERLRMRIEAGDSYAMYDLGNRYQRGGGVPQDSNKALELWHQAAKLGCAKSHSKIGNVYDNGEGVEQGDKKAKYHWERAAMGGDVPARCILGIFEAEAGNMNRAVKHFMISAGCGCDDSLKQIQYGFSDGHVTKDDFERALRAHKESKDEMQSDHRDTLRHRLNDQRD
ncbi:hypothetical protein ACHAXR_006933 [Thalassiosira sp. AJA248-18]